jgi:hypothetical protein
MHGGTNGQHGIGLGLMHSIALRNGIKIIKILKLR